jgi:hypothetical protein
LLTFVTIRMDMAGSEKLSRITASRICREARRAIGGVTLRAHEDHESLLRGVNGAVVEVPDALGISVVTGAGLKSKEMILIDFSVGGGIFISPPFEGLSYAHDSRFVKATFLSHDASYDSKPFSAQVKVDGTVVYNDNVYSPGDHCLVPALFRHDEAKRRRLTEIVTNAQSGLAVARHVERYAALLAEREPELASLDQVHADLTGYIGEAIPLAEDVEAILPPYR